MRSEAASVEEYLDSLDESRSAQMRRTLAFVRPALPVGLAETMDYGMITWSIPLSVAPDTYNGKPVTFAALASQKNTISLYLMGLYAGVPFGEDEFRTRWSGARKLNMGKSCIRYRSVDDLDVTLIEEVLRGTTVQDFLDRYEQVRVQRRTR